jgi:ribonuclease P protein component
MKAAGPEHIDDRRGEENEANLSAQQSQKEANPRIPRPHVHQGRASGHQAAPGKRAQAAGRLNAGTGLRLPMADEKRGDYRFRSRERLRKRSEYLRVKGEGRRLPCKSFVVNVASNGLEHHRLGLVVQKRFWNAVQRNRIKRCLREWFRLHKHRLPGPGKDIVVIARPGAERLKMPEMAELLNRCLGVDPKRRS